MLRRMLVISALLAAVGCGEKKIEKKEPITLDQVPANVMKVARATATRVHRRRSMVSPIRRMIYAVKLSLTLYSCQP